ncbi:MAG: MBL fold metallo-hydrolase [Methanosarcinales archaeon]|nr:MBL fold metallo-hydrolase [Methanosarcinales archaeon]
MIQIVTLADNSTCLGPRLLGEHGFSACVVASGQRLLFDAGQTGVAAHNARVLGLDLRGVPVVLSHGHYDHVDGLPALLEMTGPVPVFCHPQAFSPRYALQEGRPQRPIGPSWRREEMEARGVRFELSREARRLGPGIWLTGEIPRLADFETPEKKLVCDQGGQGQGLAVDLVPDDQALVLETDRGLVILLGCAHSGVVNTIRHARQITGTWEVRAIVGGTHLGGADEARIKETVRCLKECNLKILAPCHCTGRAAFVLAREFQDQFIFNCAGNKIVL